MKKLERVNSSPPENVDNRIKELIDNGWIIEKIIPINTLYGNYTWILCKKDKKKSHKND